MKLALGYTHSLYSELVSFYNLQVILDKKSCEQEERCGTSTLPLKKTANDLNLNL